MSDTLMECLATEARHRTATHIAIADDHRHDALMAALELAVPLRIWELRGRTPEQRAVIATRCGRHVAGHGDSLMFGGKKGSPAAAFNALAEGLAVAAYQPGGVSFAGRHWCTDHVACLAAERGEGSAGPVDGVCGDGYGCQPPTRTVHTVRPLGGVL